MAKTALKVNRVMQESVKLKGRLGVGEARKAAAYLQKPMLVGAGIRSLAKTHLAVKPKERPGAPPLSGRLTRLNCLLIDSHTQFESD